MNNKIIIKAELELITGMHIGGSDIFAAIGAADSPVITDTLTKKPIIPGSTLKGKLRFLLAENLSSSNDVPNISNEPDEVKRLFGCSSPNIIKSRLQFSDSFIINSEMFEETGLTEVKCENTIDRKNCISNPRQIERVVKGVKFGINITYNIDNPEELNQDMDNIIKSFKLLQLDYLGGHGTRGYGRVSFENIKIIPFENSISAEKSAEIEKKFKEVDKYAVLHL